MDWHSAGIQKAALQEGAILWRDLKDIRGSLEADLPNLLASSGEKKKKKQQKTHSTSSSLTKLSPGGLGHLLVNS